MGDDAFNLGSVKMSEYSSGKLEGLDELELNEKECRECGESLPLDEFHRKSSSPDGRQDRCIRCDKLRSKKGANEEPAPAAAPYVYKGVKGGPLLSGYIK